MKSIEVIGKLEEMELKVEKVNSLLGVVTEHYFCHDKVDLNSSDERERVKALVLCSQYNDYTNLIDVVFDYAIDLKREMEELQRDLYRERKSGGG